MMNKIKLIWSFIAKNVRTRLGVTLTSGAAWIFVFTTSNGVANPWLIAAQAPPATKYRGSSPFSFVSSLGMMFYIKKILNIHRKEVFPSPFGKTNLLNSRCLPACCFRFCPGCKVGCRCYAQRHTPCHKFSSVEWSIGKWINFVPMMLFSGKKRVRKVFWDNSDILREYEGRNRLQRSEWYHKEGYPCHHWIKSVAWSFNFRLVCDVRGYIGLVSW